MPLHGLPHADPDEQMTELRILIAISGFAEFRLQLLGHGLRKPEVATQ